MDYSWEEEQDGSRRLVNYIVDGLVEGYYYENASDPGIFVVYSYSPRASDYVNLGPFESEAKAKKHLRGLFGPIGGE